MPPGLFRLRFTDCDTGRRVGQFESAGNPIAGPEVFRYISTDGKRGNHMGPLIRAGVKSNDD